MQAARPGEPSGRTGGARGELRPPILEQRRPPGLGPRARAAGSRADGARAAGFVAAVQVDLAAVGSGAAAGRGWRWLGLHGHARVEAIDIFMDNMVEYISCRSQFFM